MKCLKVFFPVVLSVCCLTNTYASDYSDYADNEFTAKPSVKKPTPLPEEKDLHVMIQRETVDNRKPLWDGHFGEYTQPKLEKTVDWRDGVPLWDDSVSSYKKKDFRDFLMQPEEFEPDEYPVMDTADLQTREQIEKLLIPLRPSDNLWGNKREFTKSDIILFEGKTAECEDDDGCPFETEAECDIWRRKPMVRETVSPRSPKIREIKMDAIVAAAETGHDFDASVPVAKPLLERYKLLMNSANNCCTDGIVYELKSAGASEDLVYKFLVDDANFYGLGSRCLMMTDSDFDKNYSNTATAMVAADVRNGCLCRNKEWYIATLAPFAEIYEKVPEFKNNKFNYTYTDGLQREITVSVNNDVQNVLNQLKLCP